MRVLIEDIYTEHRIGNIMVRFAFIIGFIVLQSPLGLFGAGLGTHAYEVLRSLCLMELPAPGSDFTVNSIVSLLFDASGAIIGHVLFCAVFRIQFRAKTHFDSLAVFGILAYMRFPELTRESYAFILRDLGFYIACPSLFAFIMSVVFCVMITMLDVAFKKGDAAKLFAAGAVAIAWGSHICMQLWPTIITNYPHAVL